MKYIIVENFELEFPNSTELDLERKCGEMSSDVLELLVGIKIYRVKGKIKLIWVIIDPPQMVFYIMIDFKLQKTIFLTINYGQFPVWRLP